MQSKAKTPEEYINELPEDRKEVISKLRKTILDNLPDGFQETMGYGMIGYVVPHSIYPDGYHCDPTTPLPFISLASQKNHIGFYHMGIYSDPELLKWFTDEYPKYVSNKLDMGKSCIRFKNMNKIPYELLGELASKMTPEDWVKKYESVIKN
ncbi:DUF1801 domain-containing protein [Constantimarinum furrinae]|uniref:YdhG-like domain-containing protein n=1 Tax=Constantimarinum furrinae TaxID=2562285 RepID=A0A7G8PQY9_9FLAO|nr:DUF1801 domain-containing protein [Constantimarinum furrinae]QNJ96755.1 hypothetical protein ALE3EI_0165 [Constantimarinum furrinae]